MSAEGSILTPRARRHLQLPPCFVQFALLRLVKLDLEAEPDLTGVRYPQAAHTQGWSCSLDAGPNGANTHCIHTTAGSPYDIGDFDRGDSPMR